MPDQKKITSKQNTTKGVKRIDRSYVWSEIVGVLSFDKGIFFTVKELLFRPDACIKSFLYDDRSKLVKPFTLVLFCSLVYTVIQQYQVNDDFFDNFGVGFSNSLGLEESVLVNILEWLKSNYGYTNIVMSVFVAFWARLFFYRATYNIYELLTALLYILAVSTLIYSLFLSIEILFGFRVLYYGGIVGFIYSSWALYKLYNDIEKRSLLKSTLANLFGIFTFYLLVILTGSAIDLFLANTA